MSADPQLLAPARTERAGAPYRPIDRGLAEADPEIWEAIAAEQLRQEEHLELIASENHVSEAVLEAQGERKRGVV